MRNLIIGLLMIPSNLFAARAVMEGIPATNQAIYVTTATPRVYFNSTSSYGGGIPNVGVVVASNVVVSNPISSNNCVIYSSGSISCTGTISAPSVAGPWTRNNGLATIFTTVPGDAVAVATTAPTDVFSVGGNINISGFYKANTLTGLDTTCATASYMGAQRVSRGIVTGGSCSSAGTSPTCSSGQYLDSQTVSNGIVTGGTCASVSSAVAVVSSFTYITPGTLNSQNYGTCIATVTITVSANNGPIAVVFTGFLESDNATVPIGWSVLVNGVQATNAGLSNTVGILTQHPISSNVQNNMSAIRMLPPQGAGVKNICMNVAHPSSGAAITVRWTTPSVGNAISSSFGAYELK